MSNLDCCVKLLERLNGPVHWAEYSQHASQCNKRSQLCFAAIQLSFLQLQSMLAAIYQMTELKFEWQNHIPIPSRS